MPPVGKPFHVVTRHSEPSFVSLRNLCLPGHHGSPFLASFSRGIEKLKLCSVSDRPVKTLTVRKQEKLYLFRRWVYLKERCVCAHFDPSMW